VPVNLPTSGAPATERPKDPVWITLTKDGFRLGDAPISAADLPAALATRTGGQTATTLYLRADGSLSYRQLMQALDALRQAGYGNVALVGLDAAP
jgi:biopolymer transport protein ExbD